MKAKRILIFLNGLGDIIIAQVFVTLWFLAKNNGVLRQVKTKLNNDAFISFLHLKVFDSVILKSTVWTVVIKPAHSGRLSQHFLDEEAARLTARCHEFHPFVAGGRVQPPLLFKTSVCEMFLQIAIKDYKRTLANFNLSCFLFSSESSKVLLKLDWST